MGPVIQGRQSGKKTVTARRREAKKRKLKPLQLRRKRGERSPDSPRRVACSKQQRPGAQCGQKNGQHRPGPTAPGRAGFRTLKASLSRAAGRAGNKSAEKMSRALSKGPAMPAEAGVISLTLHGIQHVWSLIRLHLFPGPRPHGHYHPCDSLWIGSYFDPSGMHGMEPTTERCSTGAGDRAPGGWRTHIEPTDLCSHSEFRTLCESE